MIRIDSVTKRYRGVSVVDGLSLDLAPGGVTALVGPNGAGKSTLLAMIARLVQADAGRIAVASLDVSRTPGDQLARVLGLLRQENPVSARLTVRDLVALGRFPHGRGRLGPADWAIVEQALADVGLTARAEVFVDELSGGQRQRAFIAMTLAQQTACLLLDEPLNSLDMSHAVSMMRLLRRLADDQGKTVVVVVHDINIAAACSDRLVALKEGRIVHVGSPLDIMTPERLRDVFDVEAQVHHARGRPFALYGP